MKRPDIEKLRDLMARLRGDNGCPWDREQTLPSLVPFIIEEAYEVISAIDSKDPVHIKEELGDLLFQIIFSARIMEEAGHFDLSDVIDTSHEKMVRRHPHVFGDRKAETSEEVLKHWAEIKKAEKKTARPEGYLSGIPEEMPALLRAHKVSQKAAKVGFDWKDVEEVFVKLEEELNEFKEEVRKRDAKGMEEELGDLLFTIVNVSRFMEVNPENALRKTIGKFINRFHHIESTITGKGLDLSAVPLDEMERLWQEAKTLEKK
ncbi:MAG: nucleoside triphosphate pyrophosphohydrolase [Deltaproteobacteria bacterium GWC2_56_8]|nr:MAG: nucleoside triphosphate pyrophosphohydrolase [Deltaproteobacteria bacterium GWB2_55_19]OGP37159.1 MAG: nucleoside triphosphate pyrophosphohydrolase [Deltaproteobacteria bacterium GWC2_56_8]HAO93617.1 nucleoside triphosphate pyrophosphohydrolase [Deltaproteobacteria bacterium]